MAVMHSSRPREAISGWRNARSAVYEIATGRDRRIDGGSNRNDAPIAFLPGQSSVKPLAGQRQASQFLLYAL